MSHSLTAWQLVFKVISGKWNSTATGHSTFWDLLTSSDTYTSGDPFYDVQDFTSTGDTFKSDLFEQWENNYVSVQAVRMCMGSRFTISSRKDISPFYYKDIKEHIVIINAGVHILFLNRDIFSLVIYFRSVCLFLNYCKPTPHGRTKQLLC